MKKMIIISIGSIVCAVGLNFFLVPAEIATGGFTGVASLLYYAFKIPIGISLIVLNIPLFIMSIKAFGKNFGAKTLYALVLYSLMAELLPKLKLTDDPLLSVLYGGLLFGAGVGMIMANGATTGGSELAAKLITYKWRQVNVSAALFVIDTAVVLSSILVLDIRAALYAIISLFLTSKMVDLFTSGWRRARAFMIISQKSEEICAAILEKLNRGATVMPVTGAYSKHAKNMILCILERRSEIVRLKDIVKQEDATAFIISFDASEVLGEGFKNLKE